MKKKGLLIAVTALSLSLGAAAGVVISKKENAFLATANDGSYWNHYAQVTPTLTTHGSKEFWANCSTHNFSLDNPGPGEDIREGVAFDTTSYFAELTSEDPRYLPPLSERVDIKGYLQELMLAFNHDPYSYIPESMRPEGATKYDEEDVTYNFTSFVNISDINYGGFGEQWHMVIENIKESQTFYNITTYGSEVIGAANLIVYAFLDDYYDGTVSKTFTDESSFTATLNFNGTTLTYSLDYITGVEAPLFGTINPRIDMEYVIATNVKTVRIQLGEGNALKFVLAPSSYTFGLEYGISSVSRKAYFSIAKDESDNVEGHIYEFVQYKDKDLVGSCADFYISEDYTSVVGNKARAILGLKGYINELYLTSEGKLLGFEIRETRSLVTYNTLWFNFTHVSGFTNIKAIEKESYKENENPHNVYVNGGSSVFEPTYNTKFSVKTSRKYDIEIRTQYFYGYVDGVLTEFESDLPMMFVQAGENYESYSSDISKTSGIPSAISNPYLAKIEEDYATLIDIFITNKDLIDGDAIVDFIGEPFVV